MEFTDEGVVIDKPPSDLDRLILEVGDILDDVGIGYSVVSGYVAVLFGRSRATEDIDVITERFDEETADGLTKRLRNAGYWGSAMPLDDLHETLSDDLPVRIAEDGHRVPNVELKFVSDEYDRISLDNAISIRLGGGNPPYWLAGVPNCLQARYGCPERLRRRALPPRSRGTKP